MTLSFAKNRWANSAVWMTSALFQCLPTLYRDSPDSILFFTTVWRYSPRGHLRDLWLETGLVELRITASSMLLYSSADGEYVRMLREFQSRSTDVAKENSFGIIEVLFEYGG